MHTPRRMARNSVMALLRSLHADSNGTYHFNTDVQCIYAIIYVCSIIEPAFTKSKKCKILKVRKCSPTNIEVHTVPLELLHAKIYITEHINKESGIRYEVSTKGYSFLLYVYHES